MGSSIFSRGHFSSRRYNRDAVYSVEDTDLVTCNFISDVIPIDSIYYINKQATLPTINYAIACNRNTIFTYESKKLLVSRKCILLLHDCSDYELYFSDIQAVLLLEVANEGTNSYSEDSNRIYINRKYQDNSIIKAIMKKVKDFIEERNISVIYREIFPKDIVTLPKQTLTFRYVNEILGKLRYVPPTAIEEKAEIPPLELVEEQSVSFIEEDDDVYENELEDDYEESLEDVETQSIQAESTQLVPIITTEQQSTGVTTIMSLDEYVNLVRDSHEPIRRIYQHTALLE